MLNIDKLAHLIILNDQINKMVVFLCMFEFVIFDLIFIDVVFELVSIMEYT